MLLQHILSSPFYTNAACISVAVFIFFCNLWQNLVTNSCSVDLQYTFLHWHHSTGHSVRTVMTMYTQCLWVSLLDMSLAIFMRHEFSSSDMAKDRSEQSAETIIWIFEYAVSTPQFSRFRKASDKAERPLNSSCFWCCLMNG